MLLAQYAILNNIRLPVRLAQKIPMTYALACEMYRLVNTLVWDGTGRLAMRPAIAVGFGLSLRQGETDS